MNLRCLVIKLDLSALFYIAWVYHHKLQSGSALNMCIWISSIISASDIFIKKKKEEEVPECNFISPCQCYKLLFRSLSLSQKWNCIKFVVYSRRSTIRSCLTSNTRWHVIHHFTWENPSVWFIAWFLRPFKKLFFVCWYTCILNLISNFIISI